MAENFDNKKALTIAAIGSVLTAAAAYVLYRRAKDTKAEVKEAQPSIQVAGQ